MKVRRKKIIKIKKRLRIKERIHRKYWTVFFERSIQRRIEIIR